jgi:hypothetical protein
MVSTNPYTGEVNALLVNLFCVDVTAGGSWTSNIDEMAFAYGPDDKFSLMENRGKHGPVCGMGITGIGGVVDEDIPLSDITFE